MTKRSRDVEVYHTLLESHFWCCHFCELSFLRVPLSVCSFGRRSKWWLVLAIRVDTSTILWRSEKDQLALFAQRSTGKLGKGWQSNRWIWGSSNVENCSSMRFFNPSNFVSSVCHAVSIHRWMTPYLCRKFIERNFCKHGFASLTDLALMGFNLQCWCARNHF